MTDTATRNASGFTEADLDLGVESFEITPALVAANLSFGGDRTLTLPGEMVSAVERIWNDRDFTWPTSITLTRVSVNSVDGDGSGSVTRVSILGTGWSETSPVSLYWANADGFPAATISLPAVNAADAGFFGATITLTTVPRAAADFSWDAASQLVLIAEQRDESGTVVRRAEQRGLPPHIVYHWVR
ncbi:hypothetical protein [Marisediminicola sp. LYQ134]|uniref:hypothetical protein n=1 Tax=unclassified Marisediminicola TaxID=2618316 RepID=UPI003983BE08